MHEGSNFFVNLFGMAAEPDGDHVHLHHVPRLLPGHAVPGSHHKTTQTYT